MTCKGNSGPARCDMISSLVFSDVHLELEYQAALARRSQSLSIAVNYVMAVAWLSCFPKLLLYHSITSRRLVIMAVWATMACVHLRCAAALRREGRLLLRERLKAGAVLANILGAMIVIIMLKRDEIGQGAPLPASLIHAGFIVVYQLRLDTSLQLHLLSWFSSLMMELGRWLEGSNARRCTGESAWLLLLTVLVPSLVTATWEAQGRLLMVQRRVPAECAADRQAVRRKIGPFWSGLLSI